MKCRFCRGILVFLGSLGHLRWYRCRDCGCQFSKESKAKKWRY